MGVSNSVEERIVQAYKEVSEVNYQVKREVVRRAQVAREQAVALCPYVLEAK
jgi:hypothetical protein